jgi:hypothetical protein
MIEFDEITAFRLVRRLAIGQGTFAMYLLICLSEEWSTIETDLRAEVEVQLGAKLPFDDIDALLRQPSSMGSCSDQPVCALRITELNPDVVSLVDTHVVRLERKGNQLLFLANPSTAEQLIVHAPNFRSRLTEVLRITPDSSIGELTA